VTKVEEPVAAKTEVQKGAKKKAVAAKTSAKKIEEPRAETDAAKQQRHRRRLARRPRGKSIWDRKSILTDFGWE